MTQVQRRILPNCCEDWILKFGSFHQVGALFMCLPCGHSWMRKGESRYSEEKTETVYVVKNIKGFLYLDAEEGESPILNRCCSMLLVEYGPRTPKPLTDFECPICYTPWHMVLKTINGLSHEIYIKGDTGHSFVFCENPVASYLELVKER